MIFRLFFLLLFILPLGCAFEGADLRTELVKLHAVPTLTPEEEKITAGPPRYLYLTLDCTKDKRPNHAPLRDLLQKALRRNGSVIFAIEPVVPMKSRIQAEEMERHGEALKAHIISLGVPEKQVILLPSLESPEDDPRQINIFLTVG